MDNNQKMLELLERMEKANQKQVRYGRLQFLFSAVAALCCVALLIVGIGVLPQLEDVVTQAETVLYNLEVVTEELADVDLSGMVEDMDALVSNIDGLVSTSQTGVEETMQKINSIDFDMLNEAIQDLSDVIEPISKFFNSFKK